MTAPKHTPLYDTHLRQGGKMVPFAGYQMPVSYPEGLVAEHQWVRSNAGLFDVSHMGQVMIEGAGATEFFGRITPSSFEKTPLSRAKYTVLTNPDGGIIDDLIITKMQENSFFLVINAACKDNDLAWMRTHCPDDVTITPLEDRALIALQGADATAALSTVLDDPIDDMFAYMSTRTASYQTREITISRLGYTGEDGFEVSIAAGQVAGFWEALCAHPSVKPAGLGARDTLRLEMGYPLYGHDIDAATSPIEADLGWVVGKTHTGFIGQERILKEKEAGPARMRVGVRLTGKGVAREGAEICDASGNVIGTLTSGGFSPTLSASIGQGYVPVDMAAEGTKILVRVRGRDIEAVIARLPFISPKTHSSKLLKKAL